FCCILVLRSFPTRRSSDLARDSLGFFDFMGEPKSNNNVPLLLSSSKLTELRVRPGRDRRKPVTDNWIGQRSSYQLPASDDRGPADRKSTRLNSSHVKISYA